MSPADPHDPAQVQQPAPERVIAQAAGAGGGAGRLALVTGPTGYIGGRLVPNLLEAGFRVRVLARNPENLRGRSWFAEVDVVRGDAGDAGTMNVAFAGVDVGYFLLHSLGEGEGFAATDRRLAQVFADAACEAKARRLVYLGGLIPADTQGLSAHLRSRREVGEILRGCGVPTAELRAAVIIGSGSASFEMLRYLTERLPAMTTPTWVRTRIQPIAVRDVLRYLVGAADLPDDVNRTFDVGGPDVLTYAEMMQRYAAVAGLRKRLIIPVRVLTPGLSSHWVGLVTPVPASIARPLVESLRHEVVCREHDIAAFVPDPPGGLVGFDDAVAKALTKVREADVVTRWAEASYPGTSHEVWTVLDGIGGENSWYSWALAWQARGFLDRVMGGVGLRRGRRNPDRLAVGDAVDFWRVEERVPDRLLRLRAEMRLPGLAWLEFSLEPRDDGGTHLRQRAIFHPRGLAGHAYWKTISPFHALVFGPMAANIARAAEKRGTGSATHPVARAG